MIFRLILTALYNAILAVGIYVIDKKTPFGKLPEMKKQFFIGILFGLMASFASLPVGGVDIGDGTIMNVRDAAPLCAGLIFGSPAGVIAGLIGGVFRYVSAFFGFTGTYTQVACSVSTVLAGLIAAGLRKFMFDDKKPGWGYGIGIGMICEVIHMLMIFFTNANDPETAFGFVKVCSLPMMLCNGFSVGAAVFVISILSSGRVIKKRDTKHISRTFQMWLLLCIVVAYAITGTYTYVLQSEMSYNDTSSVIITNIDDVAQDITDTSDENLLTKAQQIKTEYTSVFDKSKQYLQNLAGKYGVAEISVIDNNGIITNSTVDDYIGFDMSSGEQSKEFIDHFNAGDEYFIQEYRPQSFDSEVWMKYGAVALDDGEFLQVCYDSAEFTADINSTVAKIAKNRHIGNDGFVLICTENGDVVSEGGLYSGKNLSDVGEIMTTSDNAEDSIFNMKLDGKDYMCAYEYAEGYFIVGAIPKDEALFMRDVSVYLSSFMELIIFAILFLLVYFLIKKIVIDNLTKVNAALSQITDGNLNVKVEVRANEEFASLSDDINMTVTTLKRYIAEAAARIDAELEFAKQIQHSALPSVFPPYPNRNDFDIYAHMITAKEVGGDFYDFYLLDENTVAFLIADVSGKGIPAAMFMMKAKTIIKDLAESGREVNDIFTEANAKLCENNEAGMFVTAWMAIVDLKTGLMSVANAGHNPPVIRRADGKFAYEKMRAGFVLAGMEGIKYKKTEIQLYPGDRIFLYTDGVTEATDANEQLYGEDRLLNILNSLDGNADVKTVCEEVQRDVDGFVDEAPQFDDITMVSFKLNYIISDQKIVFIPSRDAAQAVAEFSSRLTSKLDALPKISSKVSIAIDEIASNIINYSGASIAEISCTIENSMLTLRFEDNGREYDPTTAEDPDITLSAEERSIGGLGIFMVKKMAESMEHTYLDGKNKLTIVMKLAP